MISKISEGVAQLGGSLVKYYLLMGFDAIYLESGILLKNRTCLDVSFSYFDDRLESVAQAEGLVVL